MGALHGLLKPLIQNELYDSIRAILKTASSGSIDAVPAKITPDEPSRKLSILVAEDVPINQALITRILEKMGHTVTMTANGEEALHAWQHAIFDMVFMDIEMPVMDGVAATVAIRAIEQKLGSHTPISAMTAHAVHGDAEKFLASGMDDYISKPFRSSDISAAIARMLQNRCTTNC